MSEAQQPKGGKKNRKHGRNTLPSKRGYRQNVAYKGEYRRARNKARRMFRALRQQPRNDELRAAIQSWCDEEPMFKRQLDNLVGQFGMPERPPEETTA